MFPSEQKLQEAINELPKDHEPSHYTVIIQDNRGNHLATRYVRASSNRRAVLTGLKINRYLFRDRKTAHATAGFGYK